MSWTSDASAIQTVTPALDRDAILDDLLGPDKMAAFLDMSVGAFYNAVKAGHLPPAIYYGKGPRWSKAAMLLFVWSKVQEQKAQAQVVAAQAKKNPATVGE